MKIRVGPLPEAAVELGFIRNPGFSRGGQAGASAPARGLAAAEAQAPPGLLRAAAVWAAPPLKREEHHLARMKMGETAISLLHDGRCFVTGIDPAAACGRSRAWLSC